jgi:hypothetical protein
MSTSARLVLFQAEGSAIKLERLPACPALTTPGGATSTRRSREGAWINFNGLRGPGGIMSKSNGNEDQTIRNQWVWIEGVGWVWADADGSVELPEQ